ncbi:isocitrate lyase/phosphoenolpyruvate mutase family protein [Nonomuraea sp. NBC_01738]|uniref:isocitrate lyase/PEP mutase family protein n=1 Tax=Nonomuraea sp. NBC_01738 TaxID=2976003 RepID=UPI002E148197|nr:isocitrate lyase/phosphoenolpyruvate mutase family protein [Nonomuraea sp. NBC_01738]
MTSTHAATLRALHRPGDPLLLPNVWDAASAGAVHAAGFPAVATSSAAIAESLGYADGEGAPVEEMLDAIARIVAAVPLPVTADLERGYGMPPAELVERLAATGAAGCNLEDSDPRTGVLTEAAEQADWLAAIRTAAGAARVPLVINARVDTYVRPTAHGEARGGSGASGDLGEADLGGIVGETVRRARAYLAAGADCVYPILAADPGEIRAIVHGAGGPVNILFTPRTPSLARLADTGVARVSFGAGLYRAAYASFTTALTALAARRDPYAGR